MYSKEPYFVTLHGVDDVEERRRLEAAFRAAMDARFGEEAAGALLADVDQLDDLGPTDHDGLIWLHAAALVEHQLLAHLPPGPHFQCEVNWRVMMGDSYVGRPSMPGPYLYASSPGEEPQRIEVIRDGSDLVACFPAQDGDDGADLLVQDLPGDFEPVRDA